MKRLLPVLLCCVIASPLFADAAKAKKKLARDGYALTVDAFHKAIFLGETKVVALYLEAGMPADAADDHGVSALHVAARQDDSKILEMLLKSGADANAKAENGDTPLCEAADDGAAKNVELLIKANADVNAQCNFKKTALNEAVDDGDVAKVTLLVKAGADVNARDGSNETALHAAAELSDATVLNLLLVAGADVDAKAKSGATPLIEAIESDSVATTQALLSVGADPNVRTSAGFTPLYEATRFNHPKLIPLLLAAGADPAMKVDNKTMLQVAKEEKNAESIALLENAKAVKPSAAISRAKPEAAMVHDRMMNADPMVQLRKMGITTADAAALFERIRAHDARAVSLLLQAGVKPDMRDQFGRPPLWNAIEQRDVETVKALLLNGANPNDPGKHVRKEFDSGATLVMQAVDSGDVEILRALLAAGAKPDVANEYGMNALMSASMFGKADMINALIEAKANVNATDSAGTPVIWMTIKGGSYEAVEAMLNAGAKVNGPKKDLIMDVAAESPDERIRELISKAAKSNISAKAPPPLPTPKQASKKKWATAKQVWDLALPVARKWEVDADLNELTTLANADMDAEGRSHNWLVRFYSPSAQKILHVTYDDGQISTYETVSNRMRVIEVDDSMLFDTKELYATAIDAGASKLDARGIHPSVGLINNASAGPSWYFNYSDPETKKNVGTIVISAVTGKIVLNDVK